MYNTPSPPCCPVSEVHICGSFYKQIPSASNRTKYKCMRCVVTDRRNQRNLACQAGIHPMLGSCLPPPENQRWWKRLWTPSCSLQLLGPWTQEPIHSDEAEGGGTLARWIHLCGPAKTNSSLKKYWKNLELMRNHQSSLMNSLDALA